MSALELGKSFLPEVVLMDIGMPGMNGLDTARALRQEPWGRNVLLIAITGWGQAEDKRQTHDAGFDHHLVKPVRAVDIDGLLSTPERPPLA
jgi:CheY-like chemotaxis protein